MKPEHGRQLLLTFFDNIAERLREVPDDQIGFGNAPAFTDLQAKQLILPLDGKHYYCLNFALVCESKEARDQVNFLVQMIVNQTLGRNGEGYRSTEKKIRAYYTRNQG